MKQDEKTVQDIVEVGRRLWMRGFIASNDGNISVKTADDEFLVTATGVSKGFMTSESIVKINSKGEIISGVSKPSSEIKLHFAVYEVRSDAKAVVHAHPPVATGFAVAGIPLDKKTLTEVVMSLKQIPLADYGTPLTMELADTIKNLIKDHDAILLSNHGAITTGKDLFDAYYKMETLEHFANITHVARTLGGERELSQADIARLIEVTKQSGAQVTRRENCAMCGKCLIKDDEGRLTKKEITEEDLIKIITEVTNEVLLEGK